MITETASLNAAVFTTCLTETGLNPQHRRQCQPGVSILVNDMPYILDRVGLSIVVYDRQLGFVVDALPSIAVSRRQTPSPMVTWLSAARRVNSAVFPSGPSTAGRCVTLIRGCLRQSGVGSSLVHDFVG